MVLGWKHCTEAWIHCMDIMIECKLISLFFSSILRKLNTFFQSTFFSIKPYQDILFTLLTLSINSVTKKIIVVLTVYFYNSGSIFATKIYVTESFSKVRSFMKISWHR